MPLISDYQSSFLDYMAIELAASINTVSAYRSDLNHLVGFIEETGTKLNIETLDETLLGNYLTDLNRRQYSRATIARRLATIKSFIAYLLDTGIIESNPIANIQAPKKNKSLPRPISPNDIDALLSSFDDARDPLELRDRSLVWLMYYTGVRVSEVVNLQMDSLLLLPPASVRVIGKGNKERILPIPSHAEIFLREYLDHGRQELAQNSATAAVYLTSRGKPITRQSAWNIIKNAAIRANLSQQISPHTLRHSFATHLLRGGIHLKEVQEFLGHANLSTTQTYTALSDSHLRSSYDSLHPRA